MSLGGDGDERMDMADWGKVVRMEMKMEMVVDGMMA